MRCTLCPCTTARRLTTPTVLFNRPVGTIIIPSPCSASCVCALFCSAPNVFFPVGQEIFSYFCSQRILPRMRNTPRAFPAFPATEDILARTPATGAQPRTHVGARTPAATCPVPSAFQTPAAGRGNARDWPLKCLRLPYPPPLCQHRAAASHTDAGGNIPAPLPARHARRQSCQRRRRRKKPQKPSLDAALPSTHTAAAGDTDTGGNSPVPLRA